MKLFAIETGNFKLDGGAMFGVVPKSLWNKVYPADENNMVNLAMRALLVDTGERKILIDTGLGTKLDEKFASYYYLNGADTLEKSLEKAGFKASDITDVIVTHLHFDHCGGAVLLQNNQPVPAFPNAIYHISQKQWNSAMKPNPREKPSFLPENYIPLHENGKLHLVQSDGVLYSGIELKLCYGHTDGLIVPYISYKNTKVIYTADLIPTAANIPVTWITAYDIHPLLAMEEKANVLQEACENKYVLFFEHDIHIQACTLSDTPKGIRMEKPVDFTNF